VNAEWFGNTADDLTYILAAMMHIKPSKADRIINATVAKVGAVGATAGVYGVASLVGTASTGTAIGTLSGAAANSATLAWVGGSVFTGTIVVVGIAIVGGWGAMRLWRGKPRKYEELSEIEQNIVTACANLGKAFKEQAKVGTSPDNATMKVVIREGLLPLMASLAECLQIKSSKHIVTGSLAIGSRTRIILRKRKLDARITEAELWMRGYGNE
jgi:hypothetical protein